MHTQHILCNQKQIKKRSLCSFQAQICALFCSMRCFYWNSKPKAKRISWRSNTFHETRHEYERASSFHCALYLCWKWTAINTLGAAQQQQQRSSGATAMAWLEWMTTMFESLAFTSDIKIHKTHPFTNENSQSKYTYCTLHTHIPYIKLPLGCCEWAE